ncbi:DUF2750 domain-containing protein [Streptomyces sp. NPDC001515]
MSASAAQTAAFFRDVVLTRTVWWVRDDEGSPVPVTGSGQRAFPYWSSASRADHAARVWGPSFGAVSLPLEHWRDAALPALAEEGIRVGINWSGPRLTGWDFTVAEVANRLSHALGEPPYAP